jgi:hypothetical protein
MACEPAERVDKSCHVGELPVIAANNFVSCQPLSLHIDFTRAISSAGLGHQPLSPD